MSEQRHCEEHWALILNFIQTYLIFVTRHFQQYFSYIVTVSFIGGGNHRLVASQCQTLSHNVVHLALIEMRTHNISGEWHWLHMPHPFVTLKLYGSIKETIIIVLGRRLPRQRIFNLLRMQVVDTCSKIRCDEIKDI